MRRIGLLLEKLKIISLAHDYFVNSTHLILRFCSYYDKTISTKILLFRKILKQYMRG